MLRRKFVSVALAATASVSFGRISFAAENLQIIVPADAGGIWDGLGRSMAEAMTAIGARNAGVENLPGEGGAAGLAHLIDREKGNANVLMVTGPTMLGASLMRNSSYSVSATTPIARLIGDYEAIIVPASSPIRSLADLTSVLKEDAGRLTIAGGAPGGTDHILSGLAVKASGGDISRLNYVPMASTSELLAAVLGGHATVGVGGYSEWTEAIASGKVKALGVSSPEKLTGVDVPTLKEQGLDVELASWHGVVAAPGIDAAAKQALSKAVEDTVKSDAWQGLLSQKKWANLYLAGDDFSKLLESENALTAEVLRDVGLLN
jgi:putative tricarboxylic transport membrane protein